MSELRTRALVLRTFDQGESDRLLHLYTEELGRVSAVARGARRSRRRFPGRLELFALLRAQLVDSRHGALARLHAAELERAFEGLVADLGRYAIACQLLEILDRCTGERESNPELFRFAVGVLDVIERDDPDRLLALLVLAKTLARLGFRPQLLACAACGNELGGGSVGFAPRHGGAVCASCAGPDDARAAASLLHALEWGLRRPLRERGALGLDADSVRRAEALLERFFRFHVGFELRTQPFLHAALAARRLDARMARGDTAPSPSRADGASVPDGASDRR